MGGALPVGDAEGVLLDGVLLRILLRRRPRRVRLERERDGPAWAGIGRSPAKRSMGMVARPTPDSAWVKLASS